MSRNIERLLFGVSSDKALLASRTNDAQPPELKEITKDIPPILPDWGKHSYFVTLAFPHKELFKIKHIELGVARTRMVYGYTRYDSCTPKEQHAYLLHRLTKYFDDCFPEVSLYEYFFESCLSGDLHLHARLAFKKPISHKEIKVQHHRIFEVATKYKKFCFIKNYDHSKWNDYDKKDGAKGYQFTTYKKFTNISNI